jgi:hypothetical protein
MADIKYDEMVSMLESSIIRQIYQANYVRDMFQKKTFITASQRRIDGAHILFNQLEEFDPLILAIHRFISYDVKDVNFANNELAKTLCEVFPTCLNRIQKYQDEYMETPRYQAFFDIKYMTDDCEKIMLSPYIWNIIDRSLVYLEKLQPITNLLKSYEITLSNVLAIPDRGLVNENLERDTKYYNNCASAFRESCNFISIYGTAIDEIIEDFRHHLMMLSFPKP